MISRGHRTNKSMADEMGIHPSLVSMIVTGRLYPSQNVISKLASALGVSKNEILAVL